MEFLTNKSNNNNVKVCACLLLLHAWIAGPIFINQFGDISYPDKKVIIVLQRLLFYRQVASRCTASYAYMYFEQMLVNIFFHIQNQQLIAVPLEKYNQGPMLSKRLTTFWVNYTPNIMG